MHPAEYWKRKYEAVLVVHEGQLPYGKGDVAHMSSISVNGGRKPGPPLPLGGNTIAALSDRN